jgi:uncharacterized membrane protein HdeD (DUF308 family)
VEGGLIEELRQNAGWVTDIGILAIGSPLVTGMAITWTVGIFLIVGGAGQCLPAFREGAFGRALLVFLTGMVTLIAGGYMVSQPVAALASITLLLAACFLATGVLAIIAALPIRPANGWVWMLANGVITLLPGLMLWKQWPLSGAWAVGLLFGVQLVTPGVALLAPGRGVRGIAKAVEDRIRGDIRDQFAKP